MKFSRPNKSLVWFQTLGLLSTAALICITNCDANRVSAQTAPAVTPTATPSGLPTAISGSTSTPATTAITIPAPSVAPTPTVSSVAPIANPTLPANSIAQGTPASAPAAKSGLLIFRAAPVAFGSSDTISALIYSNGNGGFVNLRLISSGSQAQASQLTTVANHQDSENEPLWPQWISPAISLNYHGWKKVSFTLSQLTYRAPIGAVVSDPESDVTKADAMGVAISDSGESVMIDDLTWSSSTASGTTPIVVDDFESGNFADWASHGTHEVLSDGRIALVTNPGLVKSGRVALSIDFGRAKTQRLQQQVAVNHALVVAGNSYVTYVPKSPFTRILPTSLPAADEMFQSIQLTAGPTQIESGSFCIYAKSALSDVTVAPARSLASLTKKIDIANIDIKVVKVWQTEGNGKYYDRDAIGLTPELLLKDDRLPLVSTAGQLPQLRLDGAPVTTIPAGTSKQFWVKVTIPKYTPAGNYVTPLIISAPGVKPSTVLLNVNVLPITLSGASKQYFMGSTGINVEPADATGALDQPTKDELTSFFTDVHDHGFLAAELPGPTTSLPDEVTAYKASQLGGPLLYPALTGALDTDKPTIDTIDGDKLSLGLDSVALLAPDTASPDEFTALHKSKHTTAAFIDSQDRFDSLGDALDMPIYSVDEPYVQQLLQSGGIRMSDKFDYWYWPAYQEDPQANRLYSGLLLYRANLYGAYMRDSQVPASADEFSQAPDPAATGDDARLRHPMLIYPVQGGQIDTIQWEAVQAGVNDTRYLTTYFAALRECKDNHVARDKVAVMEPAVKQMLGKAWWVLDDTTYQNARHILAKNAVILRTALNTFYAPKPVIKPKTPKTAKSLIKSLRTAG